MAQMQAACMVAVSARNFQVTHRHQNEIKNVTGM